MMKKSTKIIGSILIAGTLVGAFFINRMGNSGSPKVGLLPDDPEKGGLAFNPKLIASQLYEAMKSSGTDEDLVFETLTNVNQNQFGLVVKAFGLKPYNRYTGNQMGVIGISLPKIPLKSWLKEELSSSMYKELRYKYPKYL